jgi:uncharacterized protein YbjT (DUF2867 family)
MRVFVAGGSGVIGRRLAPQLVARGHQVTATTTSPSKLGLLEQLGAGAVVMDGLDAVSVGKAVAAARPNVIVHQMTALSIARYGRPSFGIPTGSSPPRTGCALREPITSWRRPRPPASPTWSRRAWPFGSEEATGDG